MQKASLQGFIILAARTGLRKGAILPRKWAEVRVDDKYPFIHMPKRDSKNKRRNDSKPRPFIHHVLETL